MRFDNYMKEAAGNVAYWINPYGKAIEVTGTTHIGMIISAPEKFNLTTDKIQAIYDKYKEKLGTEGKAREEIIVGLVKKGWIRVRKYKNSGYSINIYRMTKKMLDMLWDWADKLINKGINGAKERDVYSDVTISGTDGTQRMTLQDIADFKLYKANEKFDPANGITIVESVEDL